MAEARLKKLEKGIQDICVALHTELYSMVSSI